MSHPIQLTDEQQHAIDRIKSWLYDDPHPKPYMTLGGLAGCGKTTVLSQLESHLPGEDIAFCAFAGKAVDVLRTKLTAAGIKVTHYSTEYDFDTDEEIELQKEKVTTIHSLMMQPSPIHFCGCGTCQAGPQRYIRGFGMLKPVAKNRCKKPVLGRNNYPLSDTIFMQRDAISAGLIVVDEASMVNSTLFNQLLSYEIPILACGDHGQLPPIGSDSLNLMRDPVIKLETVHRTALDSPILRVATMVRQGQTVPWGEYYGPQGGPVPVAVRAERIPGDWPIDDKTLIICATNKMRVGINQTVRRAFGYPEKTPIEGDRVICLRNYHSRNLFNGMRGVVTKVLHSNDYDAHKLEIQLDNGEDFDGLAFKNQFNAEHTTNEDIPSQYTLWDYAYAMTCHKVQGSQADDVIVVGQGFGDADTKRRWSYTAATRAVRTLLIVDRMW